MEDDDNEDDNDSNNDDDNDDLPEDGNVRNTMIIVTQMKDVEVKVLTA